MKKKLLLNSLFILFISTSLFANETDCNQFDKSSFGNTWTKFKNSKNGKEFMEKLKNDN